MNCCANIWNSRRKILHQQVFSEIWQKGGQDTEYISRAKKKKKSLKPLKKELELYQENGISLYLDGKPSSPKSIARACKIAEGGVYMRDYTEDEKGRIAQVSFDFISSEQSYGQKKDGKKR